MPIPPFDRTFQFTDVDPTAPDDGLAGVAGLPRPEVHRTPELEVMRVRLADSLFGVSLATPRIGRFRVLGVLGRGGMGVVYAAQDDELERQVAIKVLPASRAAGPLARARMTREALALARLSHPNVVQIHEVGEHDGAVYVAMECIDGLSLGEWLRALPAGARRWEAVLAVFVAAGRGLQAAHEAGLVHRDFKWCGTPAAASCCSASVTSTRATGTFPGSPTTAPACTSIRAAAPSSPSPRPGRAPSRRPAGPSPPPTRGPGSRAPAKARRGDHEPGALALWSRPADQ